MIIDSFPWEIEKRAELAKQYFDEGWSIHVAMRKAGFKATWQNRGDVVTNHVIKQMIEDNNKRWENKRKTLKL